MEDKVEEINNEEVSLIETEGPKRRSGSYLKVRLSMLKRFPMTSLTRQKLPVITIGFILLPYL